MIEEDRRECGLYCPGSYTKPEFRPPEGFNIPKYVADNLKVRSSLQRSTSGPRVLCPPKIQHTHRPMEMPTCRDNFAIAKKFHTENLEHQPLPDRVDDRVFANMNFGRARSCGSLNSYKAHKKYQEVTPKVFQRRPRNQGLNQLPGPLLGCKIPETRMDLAICWDAPIDPIYEPRRPVHIDGSDGGPAPGIFTLVQHPAENFNPEIYSPDFSRPRAASADPGKFERLVKAPPHHPEKRCRTAISKDQGSRCGSPRHSPCVDDDSVARSRISVLTRYKTEAEEEDDEGRARKLLEGSSKCHLCKGFGDIRLSEAELDLAKRYTSSPQAPRRDKRKHAGYLRNCSACEQRTKDEEKELHRRQQRLQALQLAGPRMGPGDDPQRNGLPTSLNVPRPRTPFARRSFCIDTLTPPFSVVKGCRDADYPEHWRLTTVYQQSYRLPRNHKTTLPCRMKR
ncbi:uncharacterized protein LOC124309192 [Neodiprion virginianus]|uniref:uncharacterized protein LOC124309192 n=1 Tax=Neodiprion virginianus TaxID=2961670 RepID=UPI001EE70F35|nr:uncharacterized protein LOC124309192 [Neodiprion virginianus]